MTHALLEIFRRARRCECGCGAPVRRRFLPGHDAKLKGRLLKDTTAKHWWVREKAVAELVERQWGHYIDIEVLAYTPVRRRFQGRYVETRHAQQVGTGVVDEHGQRHAFSTCPAIEGKVWIRCESTHDCSVCIYQNDLSEIVARQRYRAWVAEAPTQTLEFQDGNPVMFTTSDHWVMT